VTFLASAGWWFCRFYTYYVRAWPTLNWEEKAVDKREVKSMDPNTRSPQPVNPAGGLI
jgi:hypothetical protein